jgi:hypothetical protein
LLFLCCGLIRVKAAPKPHTVVLERWQSVSIAAESGAAPRVKIRRLLVDDRLKEYTVGPSHEVTDRLFVIRRAYRLNDSLADDSRKPPQWVWRLGGWISIDRMTGHIAQLNLPAFDAEISAASWYRDYAAYCGSSDDGSKVYMMVSQLGKRKPILKKELTGSGCPAPKWERGPSRVTFAATGEKATFVVRSHGADLQPETAEEEGPQ